MLLDFHFVSPVDPRGALWNGQELSYSTGTPVHTFLLAFVHLTELPVTLE